MKKLEAFELPVRKIFSQDYEFHIPDYQRPYAWGQEETLQLLDDLTDAINDQGEEPYFLGSLILVMHLDTDPRAEVIDGQQRLTTLTLLLAVLRDLTPDDELKQNIDILIAEPGMKAVGLKSRPRLTLRNRDAAFFNQYVQQRSGIGQLQNVSAGGSDSREAIQRNTQALFNQLTEWSEPNRSRLLTFLLTRTFLVVVTTPDLNSAHRIFSVMNSRGLDLSPADIFKSQVVGALDESLRADYAERWEDAEEALGREGFADLFLHIRMIYAKARAKKELLKEFPEQVLNRYLPERASEFIDGVVQPYADAYEIVRDESYASPHGAEIINDWLKRLNRIDNNDWKPAAIWAMRYHGEDQIFLATFLQKLERLAASMLLRRVYATPRSQRYAALLQQLNDGDGLDSKAFNLTQQDRAASIDALNGDIYLTKPVRKYVLLRLDEVLADKAGVQYNHSLITVEHVLPQTPEDSSQWVQDFTEDQRHQWTHKLANLVLLNRRKNSQAQNYDFKKKQMKYFASTGGATLFALTTQVNAAAEWTPNTLEDRQEDLVDRLIQEWALDS